MRSHYLKLAITAALLGSALAHAEDAKEEPKKGAISGLPDEVELNLTFSAGWGFFGFANSLYANSHDEVQQDLSDNWMEGFVKGGFDGQFKLSNPIPRLLGILRREPINLTFRRLQAFQTLLAFPMRAAQVGFLL